MPAPIVDVAAACRLHFGMFSFGRADARQFGGVGAMVGRGTLRLRIAPADRFAVSGPLAQRVARAVERIAGKLDLAGLPACRVEVLAAPPEHVGLGTGTQLSLALAAGLNALGGGAPLDAGRLAEIARRGARSAIGTHGFLQGGLLVERGKLAGQWLSPVDQRVELPGAWRFVLITPQDERGLSGEEEERAFRELPAVSPAVTERLVERVIREMLPAAKEGQFERFGESLYHFGHEAGLCFAARQGGAFAGPRVSELVAAIRALGVRGVGQSSWGPTVFALLESEREALAFQERLRPHLQASDTIAVAEPNNTGAIVTRHEP